jgi:hypothetical protein
VGAPPGNGGSGNGAPGGEGVGAGGANGSNDGDNGLDASHNDPLAFWSSHQRVHWIEQVWPRRFAATSAAARAASSDNASYI